MYFRPLWGIPKIMRLVLFNFLSFNISFHIHTYNNWLWVFITLIKQIDIIAQRILRGTSDYYNPLECSFDSSLLCWLLTWTYWTYPLCVSLLHCIDFVSSHMWSNLWRPNISHFTIVWWFVMCYIIHSSVYCMQFTARCWATRGWWGRLQHQTSGCWYPLYY